MTKILRFKKQIILLVLLMLIVGVSSGCVGPRSEKKPEEEEVIIGTTYQEEKFEEIKETDKTPSEINNSALKELDNLVEEVSSDNSLDDSLSDIAE